MMATLASLGLKEVVICPGSRNAPLTLSFHRHPAFHCISIRDERSAAFTALGKIIELNRPVAVVCTSGSAALNFAPAISEAYYQRLPLIVITADRPKAWTGQGDGQTINQTNIYQNYIRASYELNGDHINEEQSWYNTRSLCEGFVLATQKDKGPVHFNIPLSEPLYAVEETAIKSRKCFTPVATDIRLSDASLRSMQKTYTASERVMILAGQHSKDKIFESALKKMASLPNTIVLTESTSNVYDERFVMNIDRCITTLDEKDAQLLKPGLLITVGGAVVSKRIKAFLRKYSPKQHWNVDTHDAMMDTYQSLTHPVFMEAGRFFEQLRKGIKNCKPGYRDRWIQRNTQIQKAHNAFAGKCAYSDYFVFQKIIRKIPDTVHLHLSNSSPVRYVQLFEYGSLASCHSNRGVSGIDGCTSTAMGAAMASPEKEFVLITGDVAFHYDSNALWNEAEVQNLKIILINNGGGGIFRIISGKEAAPEMKTFFETSQDLNAGKIAATYGWNYLTARDGKSLDAALKIFFARKTRKTILEVFTDADKNPEVLEAYWNYLRENQHYEK